MLGAVLVAAGAAVWVVGSYALRRYELGLVARAPADWLANDAYRTAVADATAHRWHHGLLTFNNVVAGAGLVTALWYAIDDGQTAVAVGLCIVLVLWNAVWRYRQQVETARGFGDRHDLSTPEHSLRRRATLLLLSAVPPIGYAGMCLAIAAWIA